MTGTGKVYEVVRYSADGGGVEPGEILASGLTLAEAKLQADRGHGSWTPPEDGSVVAYPDGDAEDCGGSLVREVSAAFRAGGG